MEENEIMEQEIEISEELTKKIEAEVKRIKEENPKLKTVFPIVVFGEEYDDKETYVAYFKQPDFKCFSKYLSFMNKDSAVALRTLSKECFVDGDRELVDDDSLFLFGTMLQVGKIISARNGRLVNLSKPRK